MCYSSTIESILIEAHAYGIREEVLTEAAKYAAENKYDPAAAYERAFQEVLSRFSEQDTN
jgi:hypothetical protein